MKVQEVDNLVVQEGGSIDLKSSQIIISDSRKKIKILPDNFYSSCITSPPY